MTILLTDHGFLKYEITHLGVPVIKNNEYSKHIADEREVLQVTNMGVEEEYRGQGLGKELLLMAEQIARKNNLEEIVVDYICSEKTLNMVKHRGYHIYFDGASAIKKL